jgi:hypothetical protein
MVNRNGLIIDARLTEANGTAERSTALDMNEAMSVEYEAKPQPKLPMQGGSRLINSVVRPANIKKNVVRTRFFSSLLARLIHDCRAWLLEHFGGRRGAGDRFGFFAADRI